MVLKKEKNMWVTLVWATPEAENLIAYMARVSNPENQNNPETAPKLLKYLMDNKHWSPFEMVNVCMEIETTRDIARQILRHRSFSFQEFSQRYAISSRYETSEARLQDEKNRQNSIPVQDRELMKAWQELQQDVLKASKRSYESALSMGIAKEVARKVLPEGMTTSRMYMNGTLRSWMHYVDIRCDKATQKEHREIAEECKLILTNLFPSLFKA
jgi:thymidylate synthase (FAD)